MCKDNFKWVLSVICVSIGQGAEPVIYLQTPYMLVWRRSRSKRSNRPEWPVFIPGMWRHTMTSGTEVTYKFKIIYLRNKPIVRLFYNLYNHKHFILKFSDLTYRFKEALNELSWRFAQLLPLQFQGRNPRG